MFGEDYPRFMEVSDLTPKPDADAGDERRRNRSAVEQLNRMNERYEALFASNRDILDGARVLDLASHDGRYSFAAMKTGAAHVTGVEVRESLIDKALETFAFYGQDPETYRFVCGTSSTSWPGKSSTSTWCCVSGSCTTPTGIQNSGTAFTTWPQST